MVNDSPQLMVQIVSDASTDQRILEQQTIDLLDELRLVRGSEVERVGTSAPAGTKAIDFAEIGSILVAFGGAGGVLTSLVGVLTGWVGRAHGRKLHSRIGENEIDLTGASRAEEQKLIDAFVQSVQRG